MFKVKISSFQRETFDWKISGFPVMSVKLRKVRFVDGKGNHCDGVVSADIEITSWLVSAYGFYSRVVKDR